ncbi:MAG: SH3 domain-containing protein [Eubacteriales bacterium]|nr:SH3 domain-containing protein [Eubacteriales bacterium]
MRTKIKAILSAFCAMMMLVPQLAVLPARAETMKLICNVGGDMYRVKLRKKPSTDSAVIGQYFESVEATVLSESGAWSRVIIGGREGYMMSKYLKAPEKDGWYYAGDPVAVAYPDGDDMVGVYDEPKSGADEIARLNNSSVQDLRVLGTIDDNWLHIMWSDESGRKRYGYASSTKLTLSDNYATAITTTDMVNVRTAPSRDADSLRKLFAGVRVSRLFDNNVADDGWEKIRIGSVVGYIDMDFLSYYSAGCGSFRPPMTELKNTSAPLYESLKDNKTDSALSSSIQFSVLGVFSDRYLIRINLWESFTYNYGFIDTSAVKRKVSKSVSTQATVARDSALYIANPSLSQSDCILRKGSKVNIFGAGLVTNENGWETYSNYYICDDDEYIYIQAYGDSELTSGWVKKDDLKFDEGLIIPEKMTNG